MARPVRHLIATTTLLGLMALGADPAVAQVARLDRIGYDPVTGEIVIRTSAPMRPYVSRQGDPPTWVLELRKVQVGHVRVLLNGIPLEPLKGLAITQWTPSVVRIYLYPERNDQAPGRTRMPDARTLRIKLPTPKQASLPQPTRPSPAWRLVDWGAEAQATSNSQELDLKPRGDDRWHWRADSQVVWTSNLMQFNPGPAVAGARLSYRGVFQDYYPRLRTSVLGHIEQQTMRFSEGRFDYGSLVSSLALSHAWLPRLQLFEGGAVMYSRADQVVGMSFMDSSLFAGMGTSGEAPLGGLWFSSLTVDRVTSGMLRDNYYGQALRLGYQTALGPFGIQLQGTAQRVDPMVRSTPFYRYYAYSSLEIRPERTWSVGLRGLYGVQQTSVDGSHFGEIGPYLEAHF